MAKRKTKEQAAAQTPDTPQEEAKETASTEDATQESPVDPEPDAKEQAAAQTPDTPQEEPPPETDEPDPVVEHQGDDRYHLCFRWEGGEIVRNVRLSSLQREVKALQNVSSSDPAEISRLERLLALRRYELKLVQSAGQED